MLARIRKMREEHEGGFTLIELLVVIIIIGILAAIAIPVFLNQRKKGYDSAVKSDLRNAATAEETYLTDNGVYTDSMSDLTDTTVGFKYSAGSNYDGGVTAVITPEFVDSSDAAAPTVKNQGYCLEATSASGTVWSYDSIKGGLQGSGVGCPA
jgi:type IV pilus assembly protein PilA